MAFSASPSKESDIVKTVEDEKLVQIYTPDEMVVQLADNRRSIRNLKPRLHAGAIGIHSYSCGIHRIRARIKDGHPFFGIRSRSIPLVPREYMAGSYTLTDSTYGWESNGHYADGYPSVITPWNDGDIIGHIWTITLNCDEHRISIIDEDTKDQHEIEVDQRLNSHNRLIKVVPNTKPLGFNAQGNWEMSSVNIVMRLNKYNEGEYFAPHKDAQ
ncbi:unnamed protein product [Adineta steineri]|uniref:Uncharacterized protein n=1 Tax=Adineta steineri TaxID=433720 RepID=A0A815H833_9BILA|nr:unnamed protein product [Adineta steineri]CAF1595784.1 unnamed protein product [Adineta steineri]